MIRTATILLIIFAGFISAWGCGQSTPGAISSNNLKSLEARVSKLEKDLKATEAARDTALTRAVDAEKRIRTDEVRILSLEKERDTLQVNLKARVTEKDQLQTQFDGFRKNLKELVVQMDSASANPNQSSTVQLTLPVHNVR